MNEKAEILRDNFSEYYDSASQAFAQKKYNAATTLFFKSMIALVDLLILKREGISPSSHTSRFRILQKKHLEIYDILDRDFSFYQDSYTKKLDREAAVMLLEDVKKIKKILEG